MKEAILINKKGSDNKEPFILAETSDLQLIFTDEIETEQMASHIECLETNEVKLTFCVTEISYVLNPEDWDIKKFIDNVLTGKNVGEDLI